MNEMLMVEKYFPGGELDGGIKLINKLDWGLSVKMAGTAYVVSSGEEPILRTESKDALQAFIYGLGLAYAILPDELFSSLEESLKEL